MGARHDALRRRQSDAPVALCAGLGRNGLPAQRARPESAIQERRPMERHGTRPRPSAPDDPRRCADLPQRESAAQTQLYSAIYPQYSRTTPFVAHANGRICPQPRRPAARRNADQRPASMPPAQQNPKNRHQRRRGTLSDGDSLREGTLRLLEYQEPHGRKNRPREHQPAIFQCRHRRSATDGHPPHRRAARLHVRRFGAQLRHMP